jgi:hypothetical protein
MTIECYHSGCSHHCYHTDPDDGPFCYERDCHPDPLPGAGWASVYGSMRLVTKQQLERDPGAAAAGAEIDAHVLHRQAD